MKNIIVGCPYTGMSFLEKELKSFPDVNCLNAKDITGIDLCKIYIKKHEYYFNDIYSVFIRYPYDLIPPQSQTYNLRENTEYLKTISLLLSSKSINPIQSTWAYRNRFLSLSLADKIGLKIPASIITRELSNCKNFYTKRSVPISKAIGNCFAFNKGYRLTRFAPKYFSPAEDDGEEAIIYLAQKMTINNLKNYLRITNVAFLQEEVNNTTKEFRVYLVGKKIFIYSRLNNSGKIDRSEELYTPDDSLIKHNEVKKKLFKLKEKMKLGYLCLDMLETKDNELFLIDINPLGSLPPYKQYPSITKELARLMVFFAKD